MLTLKLKQIALALSLITSLLIGSASACACSHHQEIKTEESRCGSHHDEGDTAASGETVNALHGSCTCRVNQRSPYIAAKANSKELKAGDAVAVAVQIVPELEFVAVSTFRVSPPGPARGLSYSNTLESLLPARAPPRL